MLRGAPAGVYLHVPFCLRKCPYCDFYSVSFDGDLADSYVEAVLRTVRDPAFRGIRADTLYFGGGTPSLLGPGRVARLLDACVSAFGLEEGAEITLEANPAAASGAALTAFRRAGVNRLSVGVQSLSDGELAVLGRLHSAGAAAETLRAAETAGFRHISADLMLAVPGQTPESLSASIEALAALPVDHVSAYLLKVEEGTPFWEQRKSLPLPGEDEEAERYLQCVEELTVRGFRQYEISNFARPGGEALHNKKYWKGEPYLGIGPGAHSFLAGRRSFFPRDLEGFIRAKRPAALREDDGPGGGPAERAMLALRLTEGIGPGEAFLSPEQWEDLRAAAKPLEIHGLVTGESGRVALTPQGFLLSNRVIAALLEAAGL